VKWWAGKAGLCDRLSIIPDPSPLLREGVWTAHRSIGGSSRRDYPANKGETI